MRLKKAIGHVARLRTVISAGSEICPRGNFSLQIEVAILPKEYGLRSIGLTWFVSFMPLLERPSAKRLPQTPPMSARRGLVAGRSRPFRCVVTMLPSQTATSGPPWTPWGVHIVNPPRTPSISGIDQAELLDHVGVHGLVPFRCLDRLCFLNLRQPNPVDLTHQ